MKLKCLSNNRNKTELTKVFLMIANGFDFYTTTRFNQRSADTVAVAVGLAISSDYLYQGFPTFCLMRTTK